MVRPLRRVVLAAVIAATVAAPLLTSGQAVGKPLHRAGVVVQHSDLGTLTDCVSFKEDKIDGVELLKRSDFDFRAAKFPEGTGICWLDGEGCKTTNAKQCFCTPAYGVTASWSYWVQEHEDPLIHHGETYPSERVIHDGAIDYWTFGPHGMPPSAVKSLEEICAS